MLWYHLIMKTAAKKRTFLFLMIALACAFYASETRAELLAEDGQFSVGPPHVSLKTATSYYDGFSEVALDSSVAPRSGLRIGCNCWQRILPFPSAGSREQEKGTQLN